MDKRIVFQGIERTITNEKVTNGARTFFLTGPKVDYYAVEKLLYPGTFTVLNSKFHVVGTIHEKTDGTLIELV